MACQPISQLWTLSSLLSAFLQLLITCLLLSSSALIFFLSKFLALFGLSLTCPSNSLCFRTLLVDFPSHSLSSLFVSITSKSPFNDHTQLNLKLAPHPHFNDDDDDTLEFERQASYTSFSHPRRSHHSISGSESSHKFDRKGKGSTSHRHRSGFRHRPRGTLDHAKLTSGSFYNHISSDVPTLRGSPSDPSKIGSQLYDQTCYDVQNTSLIPVTSVQNFGAIDGTDENKFMYDNATSLDIPKHRGHGHGFDCHDENTVMILEQALELEQSARAALCAELEQERIAAATAADEAMAMISRLQEEKASVEIEARQCQRILEEKSAYDAEEMTILKEIIVRRETEIHFLEKQIEEYRKRLHENEGLECRVEDTQEYYDIMDSRVDPSLSEKLPETECRDTNIDKGKESSESCSMVHDGDEAGQEIQERGILSADDMLFSQFSKSKNSVGPEFFEENSNPATGLMSNDNVVKADQEQVQTQIIEPHVHDVHIVASKYNTCNRGVEKMVDSIMSSGVPKFPQKCDSSSEVSNSHKVEASSNYGWRVDLGINKSCLDMAERFSSLSSSPSRSLSSEQLQNSLSSVDQERLKIDGEIGCLRARLSAVQKEKEKLKSCLQSQEQGKTELRFLEDIAVLLREIRHLREPENIARQASLPPLSSKETSKRRRSRSTSVGVGQSSSS